MEKTEKFCYKCREVKPLSEFHRNAGNRDGLHTYCKACNNRQAGSWRKNNTDRYKATKAAAKQTNRERNSSPGAISFDGVKRCSACKQEKPRTDFGIHRSLADGLMRICKECNRRNASLWRQANPEKFRAARDKWKREHPDRVKELNNRSAQKRYKPGSTTARQRARRLGMLPGDYDALYAKQGGKCAICFRECEVLDVDHCHETGVIRGGLCRKCNSGIGLLGDDPDVLWNALQYLTA